MLPRALACVAAALLLAACRGSGGRAPLPERELAPGAAQPVGFGPSLSAGVDARFVPALEGLQRAVAAGDDTLSRALVAHLDSLGPDERVWQLTRAFERILDGRAAVKSLHLALACQPEPLATVFAGDDPNARGWRLVLEAENTTADAIELSPGPATLTATRTEVVRGSRIAPLGSESSSQETRSFQNLKKLALPPGERSEIELARFFLAPGEGLLAVRLSFELDLRSGVLTRDGRELPAMHLDVDGVRVSRAAPGLPEETLDLAALLERAARAAEPGEILELAVRTELAGGPAGRAALEEALVDLPRPTLELWIPAVRWLDTNEAPTDVDGLRPWLRARIDARAARAPRPDLVLPHAARADGELAH